MLKAQNMAGYHDLHLHDRSMDALRDGADIRQAVKLYRRGETSKRKLKRVLLRASGMIPAPLRAKLRKANSGRQLQSSSKCEEQPWQS